MALRVVAIDDSTGALTTTTVGGGGGGTTRSIVTVTGVTTLGATAATDYVALVSSSGTATLPTAVGNTNCYTLKNTDPVVSTTILTTSGQTIDGSATAILRPLASIDLISDNTNWNVV